MPLCAAAHRWSMAPSRIQPFVGLVVGLMVALKSDRDRGRSEIPVEGR